MVVLFLLVKLCVMIHVIYQEISQRSVTSYFPHVAPPPTANPALYIILLKIGTCAIAGVSDDIGPIH